MKSKGLKQKIGNGKKLLVDEIFYSIQTEGPFAGRPATFIRLFGCNLNCGFCDTPQESKPDKMSIKKIVKQVEKIAGTMMIVITGGEPFLQNITPLVITLSKMSYHIQLETTGTLSLPDFPWDKSSKFISIVCSPKTQKIHPDIAKHALAYKYIISAELSPTAYGLPKGIFKPDNLSRIMLSPCWEKSQKKTTANIDRAVETAKAYGYPLTLQYHKLINIR